MQRPDLHARAGCVTDGAEDVEFALCRAPSPDTAQPLCSRDDIERFMELEELHTLALLPESEIAAQAAALDQGCLHCLSTMDRPTEAQREQLMSATADMALECGDKEKSRSQILELASFICVGLFGGAVRQRIQARLRGEEGGRGRVDWWSFGVHGCPLTHPLALCQEARAVATLAEGSGGGAKAAD